MPYEIVNKLRAPSLIRLTDATTVTVNLSQLSANTNTENVVSAIITSIKYSLVPTTGILTIVRQNVGGAANTVATFYGQGDFKHDELNIANTPTGNITFTLAGAGSAWVTVKKDCTYNVDTWTL